MAELFGQLSSSLLVSFRKSKWFHPSLVKLRETHVKQLLVDSEVQDPKNYFREDLLTFRSLQRTLKPAEPTNKYDYRAIRSEPGTQYPKMSPVGFKAKCFFSPKSPKKYIIEVWVTDFFGRKELCKLQKQTHQDTANALTSDHGEYSNHLIEWNLLGWTFHPADS